MLKIAFQMDPIASVNIDADSTFDIALECHSRGHEVWVYEPRDMAMEDGRVRARARRVERLERKKGDHVALAEAETVDLKGFEVIFLRQDPPFDMAYITSTHMLERLQPEVLVVNDPKQVRNAPEKIFVAEFPNIMPPTLITHSEADIRAFFVAHGRDIVVKPLFGNGGAGVFRIRDSAENLASLVELFQLSSREPLMAQAFVPDVRNGDKRIILVDGEPVGAINRVPAEGEVRANMHVGGKAVKSDLTERDRELCAIIGPELKQRGLVFVGIDVIGDYMTEINVTSPTGIQELRRFSGVDVSALLADWVEARRAAMKA